MKSKKNQLFHTSLDLSLLNFYLLNLKIEFHSQLRKIKKNICKIKILNDLSLFNL